MLGIAETNEKIPKMIECLIMANSANRSSRNSHGLRKVRQYFSLSAQEVWSSKGFPSFAFSTINSSRLKVVAFVAIQPPISAHGRNRTFPTEQFRLMFLKNTLQPISSKKLAQSVALSFDFSQINSTQQVTSSGLHFSNSQSILPVRTSRQPF